MKILLIFIQISKESTMLRTTYLKDTSLQALKAYISMTELISSITFNSINRYT